MLWTCFARTGQKVSGFDRTQIARTAQISANLEKNSERMDIQQQVLRILDEVLSLNGRSAGFDRGTHLLGAIPELDSMAVVSLITSLEEQLGLIVEDDEIDGETFRTVGTLVDFVAAKLAA